MFDGVIIHYGTTEKRFVFTNAPVRTSDLLTWEPIAGKVPSLELDIAERRHELTISLLKDDVRDELEWLVSRVGRMDVTLVELEDGGSWNAIFTGFVSKFAVDLHYLILTIEGPVSAGMRSANRVRLSSGCIHLLGDNGCKVTLSDYRVQGSISNISGSNVTLDVTVKGPSVPSEFSENWFQYGYLDVQGEVRMIVASTYSTVTLKFPLKKAQVGDPFVAYPGCDKSLSTCESKFNNKDNFLGFPYAPFEDTVFRGKVGDVDVGGGSS